MRGSISTVSYSGMFLFGDPVCQIWQHVGDKTDFRFQPAFVPSVRIWLSLKKCLFVCLSLHSGVFQGIRLVSNRGCKDNMCFKTRLSDSWTQVNIWINV